MTIKTRKIDIQIKEPDGSIVFEKKQFEVPEGWSERAATIVASKYAMDDEFSAVDIIDRVVNQIADWGLQQNYFENPLINNPETKTKLYEITEDSDFGKFKSALKDILINQRAAFNSPVWFNCGSDTKNNQMSACFILPIEDTMESILEHYKTEGMIFRGGSGAGINISKLRGKGEKLSNKGSSTGPISFMRGWDNSAGTIKSGGKVRRAAKLVCMDADHPDIMEFIECKKHEEDKAKILIANGIPVDEAYATVDFQNTNHSVRVTDEFMQKVISKKEGSLADWDLIDRNDPSITKQVHSTEILRRTAQIAWECADPGIQFDGRMNLTNPIPNTGKINSTNPCSEFSAVDNSSCNLASLNLVKYMLDDSEEDFDWSLFRKDIQVLITAMDILVDAADYPTEDIGKMTKETRPLGLGFSNLGAMLMLMGIPYDSDHGRETAATITKEMTTAAYKQSIEIAKKLGSFKEFEKNKEENCRVAALLTLDPDLGLEVKEKGLRNSQVTLLAPTGTISFMMDCDTTGIEPLFALKTKKTLAGGGQMEIDYPCVDESVLNLRKENNDYDNSQEDIIEANNDIFATANKIPWKGHVDMMAACQRHLNGAISKTVNMPAEATPNDIKEAYIYAWKAGLKCLAIYRDGCKGMQPMQDATKKEEEPESIMAAIDSMNEALNLPAPPIRMRLPEERKSVTKKFDIQGHEGYITCGMYDDGSLGELFIRMSKTGSLVSGIMDAFATSISLGLQYGVPLGKLIEKFGNTRFEPSGITTDKDIPMVSSVLDYIFRYIEMKYMDKDLDEIDDEEDYEKLEETIIKHKKSINPPKLYGDGPECPDCKTITNKVGTCFLCPQCGTTTGCS